MERNVPKLRFKGFSDEWDEKKLEDISDVRDGTHDSPKYIEHGYPLITAKNLCSNGKIDYKNVNFISEEDFNSINKRSQVNTGDILFGMIGTIGNPVIVDRENFAIKNVALIKEKKNLKNKYLIYFLHTKKIKKQFYIKNSGGTQKFIALNLIRDLDIDVPSIKEQERIANFLAKVDKIIEKQDEKVKNLEKYKKGMMQKIFSQEIRFKDENGEEYPEWEEYQFKDIVVEARLGGNYENYDKKTAYPLIKMGNLDRGNININKVEYVPEDVEMDSEDILKYGDLLFNTRNTMELVGKVAIWRNELNVAYYNSNLLRLKFKNELVKNNFFMNYRFNTASILSILKSIATGTTSVAAIYTKDLNNIKFKLPSLQEQEKIVNLLVNIDKILDKENKKLEKLKKWQKGLLQQMFV